MAQLPVRKTGSWPDRADPVSWAQRIKRAALLAVVSALVLFHVGCIEAYAFSLPKSQILLLNRGAYRQVYIDNSFVSLLFNDFKNLSGLMECATVNSSIA